MKEDYRIGKLFGDTVIYAGYSLIFFGVITTLFNLTGLLLIVAGLFMALTYEGTLIDFDRRRLKAYTCLFGIFKSGNWYSVDYFGRFSIYSSKRRSTTYSRGNVPLTIKKQDIRLALISKDGLKKVIINKYVSFDAARREMNDLIKDLKLSEIKIHDTQSG